MLGLLLLLFRFCACTITYVAGLIFQSVCAPVALDFLLTVLLSEGDFSVGRVACSFSFQVPIKFHLRTPLDVVTVPVTYCYRTG